MHNEITTRPLVDVIAELTGQSIGIKEDAYVYLDTKEQVASTLVEEAKIIQAKQAVPQILTPRQARLVLLNNGLLDDIEALAQNNRVIGIWWEYSLEIDRNNEQLLQAAAALTIDEATLDTMFIEGSTL